MIRLLIFTRLCSYYTVCSSINQSASDCQVCFKHSDLLKRAREASIAVQQNSPFQSSSSATTGTADKTTPAEKEQQMHLVETTTMDEPSLDEPTMDEPTLDEPDLHHGSKMDKAEEFTILPGTDGGIV
jgi:hypothetical protein